MQNRLTIKDIARMSGVGKSTVSRVLNNEGSVSPQTRERVEAVIRQHGLPPPNRPEPCVGKATKLLASLSLVSIRHPRTRQYVLCYRCSINKVTTRS